MEIGDYSGEKVPNEMEIGGDSGSSEGFPNEMEIGGYSGESEEPKRYGSFNAFFILHVSIFPIELYLIIIIILVGKPLKRGQFAHEDGLGH